MSDAAEKTDKSEVMEFLDGLTASLTKAVTEGMATAQAAAQPVAPVVTPPAIDESAFAALQKSVDSLTAQVTSITGFLLPAAEGREAGAVVKAITALDERLATISKSTEEHSEILEKTLDRVENVERGGVVRKSAASSEEADAAPRNHAEAIQKMNEGKPGIWEGVMRELKAGRPVTLK